MAKKIKLTSLEVSKIRTPKISVKKLRAIRTPSIKGVTSKVYTANIRNRFRKKLS